MTRHAITSVFLLVCACAFIPSCGESGDPEKENAGVEARKDGAPVIQYLEIVTAEVEETCAALTAMKGLKFGEPVAELGGARTADVAGGGRIGVRAPMRVDEAPVVRPYILVPDVAAALEKAVAAGAEIAMTATEIPGQGTFGIYVLGGIQHGLWQL